MLINLNREMISQIKKQFLDSPVEKCGMIIERNDIEIIDVDKEMVGTEQQLIMFKNVASGASQPVHYIAEPQKMYDSFKDTELMNPSGHRIVCFVHNHPHGSSNPSGMDIRNAIWKYPYLIISKGKKGNMQMEWFMVLGIDEKRFIIERGRL